jgi:hypothetical protein
MTNRESSFDMQSGGAGELRKHMTNVAINGLVTRGDAGNVRAADNIARWKTYLPEECVRTMVNQGWHWST